MTRRIRRNRPQSRRPRMRPFHPGTLPGTVRPLPNSPPTVMQLIAYGADQFVERRLAQPLEMQDYLGKYPVCWLNVDHLGDAEVIHAVGRMFGLHPLALEDVVNVHQRAKVDPYPDHLFIVARMVELQQQHVVDEQISLFVGKHYVLTFQQNPGDCLDALRDRLRKGGGLTRASGTDYLAYAILDAMVDSYFPVADACADRLDLLEDHIDRHQADESLESLHELRNQLLMLRRNIRPHRDAINELIRDDHPLISAEARMFLRDCYDHTIQLIDLLEIYREMCGDLRDYYLSVASHRMNEIMKVLTIMSTLFMPLSFIAGVYGMNFDTRHPWNMPELRQPWGYAYSLGLMLLVTCGLIYFFWRRGWIGRRPRPLNSHS